MTLEAVETAVRSLGASLLAAAVIYSGIGAVTGAGRARGRSIGLANRMRAHTVYLITAIPYVAICVLLWRPLPLELTDATRIALVLVGSSLGLAGAAFYILGRRQLGAMYNVSASLGSELYENHALVMNGPYALCRHPMYLGIALAAAGGLMVYRTWTLVFMAVSLIGVVTKARKEEGLLAAEFGDSWKRYAAEVPPWIPRLLRRSKEVSHVNAAAPG